MVTRPWPTPIISRDRVPVPPRSSPPSSRPVPARHRHGPVTGGSWRNRDAGTVTAGSSRWARFNNVTRDTADPADTRHRPRAAHTRPGVIYTGRSRDCFTSRSAGSAASHQRSLCVSLSECVCVCMCACVYACECESACKCKFRAGYSDSSGGTFHPEAARRGIKTRQTIRKESPHVYT